MRRKAQKNGVGAKPEDQQEPQLQLNFGGNQKCMALTNITSLDVDSNLSAKVTVNIIQYYYIDIDMTDKTTVLNVSFFFVFV